MDVTTQHFIQFSCIFGAGYVMEQHGDATRSHLPAMERPRPVLNFEEFLKTLRTALSLRRS